MYTILAAKELRGRCDHTNLLSGKLTSVLVVMLHISCNYKSKRNDFIEGQLYGTNTSAFVNSADDKICIRFYALFFLEHLLRSTAMQMCLIMINIPNQKYGQKNLPV